MDPKGDASESNIVLDVPVKQPAALEIEASVSQRIRHDFQTICLFSDDEVTGPDPVPAPIQINSIYQSTAVNGAAYNAVAGTVLTIVLNAPFQGFLSDWIHVYGLVDNRLNYPNLAVSYISYDRKTLTCGFSDEAALPSLAATYTPGAGTVFIAHYNNMAGAKNGFGMRLTSSTPTSGALVSVFGGNDVQVSSSLVGDHRVTIPTSNPIYNAGVNGQVEIRATSRYRLEGRPQEAAWLGKATNTYVQFAPIGTPRTAVKPAIQASLRARFRAYSPKSMTRPIAKIVSAVKTGTTTATITTELAHGLATGNWITIKGNRDQVAFANFSTPVQVTVLTPTTFTCVYGTAVTATTYGGAVIITNGGIDQQGMLGQIIQNVQVIPTDTFAPDQLILTGSAAWSTGVGVMNIGDYVEVYGARDNTTGADLGVDGAWEVAMISTTTLTLIPVYNIMGTRVSPAVTIKNVAAGGMVLHRTTLRAHDIQIEGWSESKVMIDGQGTTRIDKAVPVAVLNTASVQGTVTGNQGARGTVGAGWYVEPDNILVADIASAALTTTTTTAAITPTPVGAASEFNIIITAVTGTTPTLDVGVEESDDTGTNWYHIYDFPRITANGAYRSPVLPLTGNRIRYVQTVAGTTPSFTRAVNRITHQMVSPPPFRQIIDRTIVHTTGGSATATLKTNGAKNIQLICNLGAATTPPVLKLQGSDDNGGTWYDIPAGSLTTVAASTVQVTVANFNTELVRGVVGTAGATVTAGYVIVKAYGG